MLIFELNVVYNIVSSSRGFIIKDKIQNAYGINRREFKVPVAALSLLLDGEGRIKQTAIPEEILFSFLQLNNKKLTTGTDTVQIKDGLSV